MSPPDPRQKRMMFVFGGVLLAGVVGALLLPRLSGPDAATTCAHYQQKHFDPMPQKAKDACQERCDGGDETACETLESWARREANPARPNPAYPTSFEDE